MSPLRYIRSLFYRSNRSATARRCMQGDNTLRPDHFHGFCAREERVSLGKTLFATRQNVHTNPKYALELLETRVMLSATVGFEDIGAELMSESFFNGPTDNGVEQPGPFGDTVVIGTIASQGLEFNNSYSLDFDSWTGFAVSNVTDNSTPGFGNQYSSLSGSGADSSATYGVVYTLGTELPVIRAGSGQEGAKFQSLQVNNTTYTGLAMAQGDDFSKKFGGESGDEQDWLLLTITGLDLHGDAVGTVEFYLADYRFSDNSLDYIVDEWTTIDVTSLTDATQLQFELSSSDVGAFGMNTPAYFAVDNVEYLAPDDLMIINQTTGEQFNGQSNGNMVTGGYGASWTPVNDWQIYHGDFNGDGFLDTAGRNVSGDWEVALSGAAEHVLWGNWNGNTSWSDVIVGDLNGDQRDDLVGQNPQGEWWGAISTGDSFQTQYWGRTAADGWVAHRGGDFNGDGLLDIVHFRENGERWVTESTGNTFAADYYGAVSSQASAGWQGFLIGDFNGDGRDDIAQQASHADGQWWLGISQNKSNGAFDTVYAGRWSTDFAEFHVADFNGDGRDDIAGRTSSNQWWLNLTQPNLRMQTAYWNSWAAGSTFVTTLGDFNADGLPDIAGLRIEDGALFVQQSTGSHFISAHFGTWEDLATTVQLASGWISVS